MTQPIPKAWEFVSVYPEEKGVYGKRIAESKWQSNYSFVNRPQHAPTLHRKRTSSFPEFKITSPTPISKKRSNTRYHNSNCTSSSTPVSPILTPRDQSINSPLSTYPIDNHFMMDHPPANSNEFVSHYTEFPALTSSVAGSSVWSLSTFCNVTSTNPQLTNWIETGNTVSHQLDQSFQDYTTPSQFES